MLAPMPRLRWGDDAPADPGAARQRIVDAAEACIDRYGLAKTTVEDVAGRAEVSRATVYRYFGNRDELLLAVLLRGLEHSMEHGLDDFFADVRSPDGFAEAVINSSVYLLDAIRHDPKLEVLLDRESGGLSATITGASEALFAIVLDEWRPALKAAQGQGLLRPDVEVDELSEWVLRCILSLLTVEGPEPHTPETERRLLLTFLAPALAPAEPSDGAPGEALGSATLGR